MTLDDAIRKVQSEAKGLTKDASAVYGKYATLGNVMDVLRPHLEATGLLVVQAPNLSGPDPCLTTRLSMGEEVLSFDTPLVLDKETMQGVGSAITYARRYALVSIFFMDADEDDDGAATAGSVQSGPKTVTKKKANGGSEAKARVL